MCLYIYKKSFSGITVTIIAAIFLSSCGVNTASHSSDSFTIASSGVLSDKTASTQSSLPSGFTRSKVKYALAEYLNYRLWLYPDKIMDAPTEKSFEKYIGKTVDIEIRVYDNSEKQVYASTSMGEWLALFDIKDGFVYCDGQVGKGEKYWPKENGYRVIENYSLEIQKPNKPNYGSSERKNKMIVAIEAKVKWACEEDFSKGEDGDEWENVDAYIVNFYEYEMATHVWLCKKDGSITDYPVYLEDNNGEFKVQTNKGYSVKNKDAFNKFGRFQFDRDINDAAKHLKCNVK